MIICTWDPVAGEAVFEVAEEFHALPFDAKLKALEDLARLMAGVRAEIALGTLEPFAALSPGEREVIGYVLRGMRSREIAEALGKSVSAIDTMRSRALAKTRSSNMAQLVLAAVRADG